MDLFRETDYESRIPSEWSSPIKVNAAGVVHAVSPKGSDHVADRIAYGDNLNKVKRCLECPLPPEKCTGYSRCWYMTGKPEAPKKTGRPPEDVPVRRVEKKAAVKPPEKKAEAQPRKPKPPYGYDRAKLDAAMVHAYTEKEVAKALDVSLYMARKWISWRYLHEVKRGSKE